jgi:hypothetical protein
MTSPFSTLQGHHLDLELCKLLSAHHALFPATELLFQSSTHKSLL